MSLPIEGSGIDGMEPPGGRAKMKPPPTVPPGYGSITGETSGAEEAVAKLKAMIEAGKLDDPKGELAAALAEGQTGELDLKVDLPPEVAVGKVPLAFTKETTYGVAPAREETPEETVAAFEKIIREEAAPEVRVSGLRREDVEASTPQVLAERLRSLRADPVPTMATWLELDEAAQTFLSWGYRALGTGDAFQAAMQVAGALREFVRIMKREA